jgi:hypothetical protein
MDCYQLSDKGKVIHHIWPPMVLLLASGWNTHILLDLQEVGMVAGAAPIASPPEEELLAVSPY